MNQEQVKELLVALQPPKEDVTITFTGKESKKVDGLYKPADREILIHNKNFINEEQIVYTAIHEYAHHLQFTESPVPVSSRAHTTRFWNTFHTLLKKAEEKGIYNNPFKRDERFLELTREIKEKFLMVNGGLMKELGGYLLRVQQLCIETGCSFQDYVDRELGLPRAEAKNVMKVTAMDIPHQVGYDNMKMLSRIKDDDMREMAMESMNQGFSPDMVKATMPSFKEPDNKLTWLLGEKDRVEKQLETLTVKLAKLELKIDEMKNNL
jgi:hypothetical protein